MTAQPHGKGWMANRKPRWQPGVTDPSKPVKIGAHEFIIYTAPTAAQQIAAAFERRRQPIPLGTYGRVEVIDNAPGCIWLDINNPNVAFSADDCREAAHLFNQIAETLEAQSCE